MWQLHARRPSCFSMWLPGATLGWCVLTHRKQNSVCVCVFVLEVLDCSCHVNCNVTYHFQTMRNWLSRWCTGKSCWLAVLPTPVQVTRRFVSMEVSYFYVM